jgi:hypothetical protein
MIVSMSAWLTGGVFGTMAVVGGGAGVRCGVVGEAEGGEGLTVCCMSRRGGGGGKMAGWLAGWLEGEGRRRVG